MLFSTEPLCCHQPFSSLHTFFYQPFGVCLDSGGAGTKPPSPQPLSSLAYTEENGEITSTWALNTHTQLVFGKMACSVPRS